jgi:hypothetical protein
MAAAVAAAEIAAVTAEADGDRRHTLNFIYSMMPAATSAGISSYGWALARLRRDGEIYVL